MTRPSASALWSESDLSAIEAAQEVHFATRQRDGSARTPRIIWVVTVGERVFIRSANGRRSDWYRWLQATHTGRLDVGRAQHDVTAVDVRDEPTVAADAAYHDKYGRAYASIVKDLVKGEPRETTLELLPG